MSLQDLNEKLHGRELHLDRTREHTTYDPEANDAADAEVAEQFKHTEQWAAEQNPTAEMTATDVSKRQRRRKITIIIGIIASLILIGGIVFKVRSMLFAEDRVELSITGPQNVASAELVTYTFTYSNNNLAALHNATLLISYPDSFHPESANGVKISGLQAEMPIGDIVRNGHGKASISGKFYGSRGELDYLKAVLRYTPSNTSATFETGAQFGVNLASSAVSFDITAPLEMATGQDAEYVVDYGNESSEDFTSLKVKMDYPDGFRFVSAEPRPSEGESVWYIGSLPGNGSGKIVIRGTLSGNRGEYKKVRGMIGFLQGDGNFVSYNVNEKQTKMIASPLSIYQTVNGLTEANAAPGEKLQYSIKYRNDGDISVRDAIVTLELSSSYLDFSRLDLGRSGAYDQARKMIVWKASDVPELARIDPGKEGALSFSIPVKEAAAIQGSEKNVSVRSQAMIDSPDVPTPIGSNKVIASNTIYVRLGAFVMVGVNGYYQDTVMPNVGPVPPVVGQETTYTFHLSLNNSSNDMTGAKVAVAFPTGIVYKKKSLPESETVVFNDRTNELTWEVGTLAAGKRELVFQIGATPAANQANHDMPLVNKTVFTATDSFTHEDIRIEKEVKTTNLQEDPSIRASGSNVVAAPITP